MRRGPTQPLTTEQQLALRAQRILTDGREHAPAAIDWAWKQAMRLNRQGFTLRELSLGAKEWA